MELSMKQSKECFVCSVLCLEPSKPAVGKGGQTEHIFRKFYFQGQHEPLAEVPAALPG
jgi:hypothetical protein